MVPLHPHVVKLFYYTLGIKVHDRFISASMTLFFGQFLLHASKQVLIWFLSNELSGVWISSRLLLTKEFFLATVTPCLLCRAEVVFSWLHKAQSRPLLAVTCHQNKSVLTDAVKVTFWAVKRLKDICVRLSSHWDVKHISPILTIGLERLLKDTEKLWYWNNFYSTIVRASEQENPGRQPLQSLHRTDSCTLLRMLFVIFFPIYFIVKLGVDPLGLSGGVCDNSHVQNCQSNDVVKYFCCV